MQNKLKIPHSGNKDTETWSKQGGYLNKFQVDVDRTGFGDACPRYAKINEYDYGEIRLQQQL